MADRPVLIVSDSRGRLLDQALNSTLIDIPFQHYWQSGLRLSNTAEITRPIILQLKPKLIYFLNGICDITKVTSRNPWIVDMRNPSPDNTCINYMITLDQLHSDTFGLSTQVGHHLMIIFSSQTGIDIGRYNNEDHTSPQQGSLNKAMYMINKNVQALKRSTSVVTPFLSSDVHHRCRGKHRLVSNKLIDGCHPTPELCITWAKKLRNNILINYSKYDHYALINHMYNN